MAVGFSGRVRVDGLFKGSTPSSDGVFSTPIAGHDFITWFPHDEDQGTYPTKLYDDVTVTYHEVGTVVRDTVSGLSSVKSADNHLSVTLSQTYTSYTVSMWINNTYNGGTTGGWVNRAIHIGAERIIVYRDGRSSDGFVYSPNSNVTRHKSSNFMSTYNGLHHMVWTRSGNNCTVYVNGNNEGSFTGNVPSASLSSFDLQLTGTQYNNPGFSRVNWQIFDGAMDATDVSTLYSNGAADLSDRTNY